MGPIPQERRGVSDSHLGAPIGSPSTHLRFSWPGSIIDLAKGHQPLTKVNGDWALRVYAPIRPERLHSRESLSRKRSAVIEVSMVVISPEADRPPVEGIGRIDFGGTSRSIR